MLWCCELPGWEGLTEGDLWVGGRVRAHPCVCAGCHYWSCCYYSANLCGCRGLSLGHLRDPGGTPQFNPVTLSYSKA